MALEIHGAVWKNRLWGILNEGLEYLSALPVYIIFIIQTHIMACLDGRQELQFLGIKNWGQFIDNLITLTLISDYNNQIADRLQTGSTG